MNIPPLFNKREVYRKKLCHQRQNRWHCLRMAITDTFYEYTQRTKVSGMWLLQSKRTHGVSRFLWSAILITLLLLGVYLSLELWMKFYSYPILNTISNELMITEVAFPAISICSAQLVKENKVKQFVNDLRIPHGFNVTTIMEGFQYINSFTDPNWKATELSWPFNETDETLAYNKIDIKEAAVAVSSGCADFAQRCFWGEREFPCLQKHSSMSFQPTFSHLGPCCSFNYNPTNATYVPFAANTFGMEGGLTVIGREGAVKNVSSGLVVLVHHPRDYVIESTSTVTISMNSENFVEIYPTVESASQEVLKLAKEKRNCLIDEDFGGTSYRQATCIRSCQRIAFAEKCQCYPYHMRGVQLLRECKLNDTDCYSANIDYFKSVRCEHCLPNCFDITYSTMAHMTDVKKHGFSISSLYTDTNFTADTFIVRAYLAKQVVPGIRKVTVMSWIGLLSDLGGVFNLCLGLSMLSLVELLYFCSYRLYVNYKMRSVLLHEDA